VEKVRLNARAAEAAIRRRGLKKRWLASQLGLPETDFGKVARGQLLASMSVAKKFAALVNADIADLLETEGR